MAVDSLDGDVLAASVDDPDQFRLIWERYAKVVFRYAARRAGREAAPDVVAEVFLRAFERRGLYRNERTSCLPWLYRIAYNVIGERIHEFKRSQKPYLVLHLATDGRFEDEAENRVVAESVCGNLREALSRLSDDDRETLLLFAVERLTYSEVASAVGVPSGTVASRINRARRVITEQIPDLQSRVSMIGEPAQSLEGDSGG